ncbi:hypothetical protein [Draconibacterium sp.]|uniref:hypothetical protein n=1 Tax=Draconibacterium sp. TaxID=1965318 RepID=UPI0035616951
MKNLLVGILLLPFFAVGQINDTWDAVKVGTTDMGKIYVGSTLVWQKASGCTSPSVKGVQYFTQTVTAASDRTVGVGGASAGDLAIVFAISNPNVIVSANTSGFTLEGSTSTGEDARIKVFSKVLDATDISNGSVSFHYDRASRIALVNLIVENYSGTGNVGVSYNTGTSISFYNSLAVDNAALLVGACAIGIGEDPAFTGTDWTSQHNQTYSTLSFRVVATNSNTTCNGELPSNQFNWSTSQDAVTLILEVN